MSAHALVLEAIIERSRTGRGRAIEVAMFDAMADWMSVPLLHLEHMERETPRCGLSHASIFPYAAFSCADGQIMIAIQSPAEWQRFCEGVLDDGGLATDERFATNPARVSHRLELTLIIERTTTTLTCQQLIEALDSHQIAWGRVSSVAAVAAHDALRRISAAVPGGEFQLPRPVGRTTGLPAVVPALDEHGPAVRREFG
jgi:crotonobetainyl-CoA:carnitine CoA-transferase CaiB-like acyl-CoA transferase